MQVIQVDVVNSQPTGAVLEGLPDGFRPAAAALGLGAELGGQDYVVATVGQHPGDEPLIVPVAVNVGGINVIDPAIQGGTQQCLRLAVLGGTVDAGQAHRPDTDGRDRSGGLAQPAVAHARSSSAASGPSLRLVGRWRPRPALITFGYGGASTGSPVLPSGRRGTAFHPRSRATLHFHFPAGAVQADPPARTAARSAA